MKVAIPILATFLVAVQTSANPVQLEDRRIVSCPKDSAASSFYRLYDSKTGDHFYTTSSSEKKSFGREGYTLEGVTGLIFKSQQKNTGPLYRLYREDFRGDFHFYTMNKAERDAAVAGGFTDDGTAGYIFATQICGSIPLYRYYNGRDHFYTANRREGKTAVAGGYKSEGIAGYIISA
ncbi:hypothetical protein DFH07DRAFT_854984 [Mycena maculata]|uniref:DUF5648 domain-containing protein n=1 Tax=Mycena maculata TaxID=230809 RepID=A0AAD7MNT4_9AGAR|nr:hypothetical protein DFH07DRAFT_854984 [Mycena maculata]